MNDVLDGFLDWVTAVDPVLRTLIAGVFILLETSVLIGLIVPGDTVVLIASTGVENLVEYFSLVAVVVAGALGGSSIGFAIGRHFGPWLRRSRLGGWIGEHNWLRAEHFLDKRGGIAVFVSRFLPVFGSLTPLLVGMSHLRYRVFIAWLTPASVVWAFLYVSAGYGAADGYRELSERFSGAAWVFAGILGGFLVLMYAVKRVLDRYMHHQTKHLLVGRDRPDRANADGNGDESDGETATGRGA
ncbi:DedA family protein [Microcella sp.]|uniref:DedA family protein n=1 Tax=Microcella sp. TaxID=1913979 RepID=UPI00391A33A6